MFIWVVLNENVKQARILKTITEICSSPGFLLVQWKNYLFPRNRMRIFPHGPVIWKVMQRNVWSDSASCRTKLPNICTKLQLHALMTVKLKKKKMGFVGELSTVCSQIVLKCLYLARIGRPDIFMVCEQTCTRGHKIDKILWQTLGAFDLVHSSYKWIPTILLCGKHSTTMPSRIISQFWFCKRSRRLKINIRWTLMHFRKSNIRAKKLTSVSHSATEAEIISLDAGLRMAGMPVLEVFHSSPNQTKPTKPKDAREPRENLSATLSVKRATTNSNNDHHSRSDQYWSRSFKRNTFWFQCYVCMSLTIMQPWVRC